MPGFFDVNLYLTIYDNYSCNYDDNTVVLSKCVRLPMAPYPNLILRDGNNTELVIIDVVYDLKNYSFYCCVEPNKPFNKCTKEELDAIVLKYISNGWFKEGRIDWVIDNDEQVCDN